MELVLVQGGYLCGAARSLRLMDEIVAAVMTGASSRKELVHFIEKSTSSSDPVPLKVFVFCELFIGGYSDGDKNNEFESCDGSHVGHVRMLSKKHRCAISFGYPETAPKGSSHVFSLLFCFIFYIPCSAWAGRNLTVLFL
jgi:hypothetical protein